MAEPQSSLVSCCLHDLGGGDRRGRVNCCLNHCGACRMSLEPVINSIGRSGVPSLCVFGKPTFEVFAIQLVVLRHTSASA